LLDSEQLRKRAKNEPIKAENAVQYAAISLFMFRLFVISKPPKQQNEPVIIRVFPDTHRFAASVKIFSRKIFGKFFNAEWLVFRLFIFDHESSKGLF
jgi:hypothetical protein